MTDYNDNNNSTGCSAVFAHIYAWILGLVGLLSVADNFKGCIRLRGCTHITETVIENTPREINAAKRLREKSVSEQELKQFLRRNKKFVAIDESSVIKNLSSSVEDPIETIKNYETDIKSLSNEFGESSELIQDYHNKFNQSYNIRDARIELIPKELRQKSSDSKSFELYSLFKGIRLNESQAKLLSEMTGTIIPPTSKRYDNYVLLQQINDQLNVKTTNFKNINVKGDIFKGVSINKNTRVIIDGKVNKNLIESLQNKGIIYIRTVGALVRDINLSTDDLEFIYVASKNKKLLKSLFQISDQQVPEMLAIIKSLEKNKATTIIDNSSELRTLRDKIKKSGKVPILIFNSVDNELFGIRPVGFEIVDFITCKSYGIENLPQGHITTDFIYFEHFTKSIEKAQSMKTSDAEEFWHQFSIEYNRRLLRDKLRFNATVVMGVAITGSGGFAIYYNNTKKHK